MTTTEKKMTKAEHFRQVMENYPLTEEDRDFLAHEVEQLAKKNSSRKPTTQQKENEALCGVIYDSMEDTMLYTVTDLLKTVPELAGLSNQKVSALMRKMRLEHRVEDVKDKKKTYFRKIAE